MIPFIYRPKSFWCASHKDITCIKSEILGDVLELVVNAIVHVASDVFLFCLSVDLQFKFNLMWILDSLSGNKVAEHKEVVLRLP